MSSRSDRPTAPGSALAAVEAFLRELETDGRVSRAVRRQRGWALREAVLFAAARSLRAPDDARPLSADERVTAEARTRRIPLTDLLDPGFGVHWLGSADAVLRGVEVPVVATQRARMTSLRALAVFAGSPAPDHQSPKPALRPLLTAPEIASALRALTRQLPGRGPDDHVRLAAVLAVMSVWPARSGELSAVRVTQVQGRGSDVVLRLTEAADDDGSAPSPVLRGIAAERLRDWLSVREGLAAGLQGGEIHSLWTSIRSNSKPGGVTGSLPLPPGMPLKPRGLQRAYARSVVAANVLHAGQPGFPLPRSLDLLRRSLRHR